MSMESASKALDSLLSFIISFFGLLHQFLPCWHFHDILMSRLVFPLQYFLSGVSFVSTILRCTHQLLATRRQKNIKLGRQTLTFDMLWLHELATANVQETHINPVCFHSSCLSISSYSTSYSVVVLCRLTGEVVQCLHESLSEVFSWKQLPNNWMRRGKESNYTEKLKKKMTEKMIRLQSRMSDYIINIY